MEASAAADYAIRKRAVAYSRDFMSPVQAIAADLVELFDDGIAPIYVLDDRRRIVFCNTACARWAGTTDRGASRSKRAPFTRRPRRSALRPLRPGFARRPRYFAARRKPA